MLWGVCRLLICKRGRQAGAHGGIKILNGFCFCVCIWFLDGVAWQSCKIAGCYRVVGFPFGLVSLSPLFRWPASDREFSSGLLLVHVGDRLGIRLNVKRHSVVVVECCVHMLFENSIA